MKTAIAFAALASLAGTSLAQVGYSVQSNGNGHLYRIDLPTGAATDLGLVGLADSEGVDFGAGGQLYSVGGSTQEFWNITTPPGSLVGATGALSGIDSGLGYNRGIMYQISGNSGASAINTVNTATGAVSALSTANIFGDDLAFHPATNTAYIVDSIFADSLFSVDVNTGITSLIGNLGLGDISEQTGTDFDDSTGVLWMIHGDGNIYTVDLLSGAASFRSHVSMGGATLQGFEGLGIIPAPSSLALVGLAGLVSTRRRR